MTNDERFARHRHVIETAESIYVEETGVGEAIVLCHGLGGNHAIWWRQLDALACSHRVVTWDQRGFGNSTAAGGRVGIGEAATDLLALLTELHINRAHLVGQSMGAFVALRAALSCPHVVESLVLSTTLAGADERHTRALSAAVPNRERRDRHPVISRQFSRANPDLVGLYNLISSFGAKPPIGTMLDSMARHGFTDDELRHIRFPVLFLAAAEDSLCPPEVMRCAADRVPGAVFEVIPGAGHSAYYEAPDAWNTAVLDFIESAATLNGAAMNREESHVD